MIRTPNHGQGNARAASGDSLCGMGTPARIVDRDQSQFRGNSAPVGQPRHISRRSLPRTWPGDLARRPGLFLIRTAGGLCMGITRRADALAPSRLRRPTLIAIHSGWHRQAIARTRWPAVQIRRGISARTLSFNTGHHVPAKFADGPHVERLSSAFVASTDSDGARQWACQNQTMRMFA